MADRSRAGKYHRGLFWVAVLCALASCTTVYSTPEADRSAKDLTPQPGRALIYAYNDSRLYIGSFWLLDRKCGRDSELRSAINPDLFKVYKDGFSVFDVSPGTLQFRAENDPSTEMMYPVKNLKVKMTVAAGETRYMHIDANDISFSMRPNIVTELDIPKEGSAPAALESLHLVQVIHCN
jgi:hypothetical protein